MIEIVEWGEVGYSGREWKARAPLNNFMIANMP